MLCSIKLLNKFIYVENPSIRHLSFDFWCTLGFSNPIFKQKRSELLAKRYNKSVAFIDKAFSDLGNRYNNSQENTVAFKEPKELFNEVIMEVSDASDPKGDSSLYDEILFLFKDNQPIVNSGLREVIDYSVKNGIKISILSNTAFIPGSSIKDLLVSEFGEDTFSFFLFSDEVRLAKPSFEVFSLCHKEINRIHQSDVIKEKIVHIGDNYDNDYIASLNYGFKSYLLGN